MSDNIGRPSHVDDEANSRTSLQAPQPSWMSHWTKTSLKPTSVVNNSEESRLKIQRGFLKSGKRSGKQVVEIATGMNIIRDKTGYPPILALKLGQGVENTSSVKARMDHEHGDKAISLALSLGQGHDFPPVKKNNLRSRAIPHSHKKVGSTSHANASRPVAPSNDNFTCLDQGRCKYQNFSTFLVHEKNMNREPSLELSQNDGLEMQTYPTSKKKNFLTFFQRNQSENLRGQNSISPKTFCDEVPCSVRNVETMRICTMVKSVENNSLGVPSKISERAHHFLFTKETCVDMSEGHQEFGRPSRQPGGVKIQPLSTSTDSEEKESTGNPSICIGESRNGSSDETEAMQVDASENQHVMLGKELCPSNKDDAVYKDAAPLGLNSNMEKARRKRPISDIPDMNEALPLPGPQHAVSSTDGTERSTSRVHSLNARELFPGVERTSLSSELNSGRDRLLGLDGNNRWIKRLKTSQDSFGVTSNMVSQHQYGKDQMVLHENVKSVGRNEVSSSLVSSEKKTQNTALESSWIRRWCRNNPTPLARNPDLVVCEPHSLKLSQDELSKKQFPSIAAMALMGKAMNGFRPCEFRKRGPIVVWNTDEY